MAAEERFVFGDRVLRHGCTGLWVLLDSRQKHKAMRSPQYSEHRAGGAGPTTPTLVAPKIFLFMVKALYFQSSGQTSNCQIEVLF